jgi:hypothetical protein
MMTSLSELVTENKLRDLNCISHEVHQDDRRILLEV